jgi:flavin reductase
MLVSYRVPRQADNKPKGFYKPMTHLPSFSNAVQMQAQPRLSETREFDATAAFKSGMRRLASGVCVVTTKLAHGPVGLLSTSVTSVSADPPVLLFCVNKSTSSHDAFLSSKSFCVNVLEESDQMVATRFGSPDFRHVRFEDRDWQKLATGSPALKGCSVSFDCEMISQIAVSTHTIFLGHVLDIAQWTEHCSPLLYWNGDYHLSNQQSAG